MNLGYMGFLFGSFLLQIAGGYIVGGLIGVKKRRRAALIGALIASLILAYLGCGPRPIQNYDPLAVWLLSAAFFWWRIGRAPTQSEADSKT